MCKAFVVTFDQQAVIDALASPIRREILWLTRTTELSAGEIGRHFDRSAATISTHLTTLRESGLIDMRADGNFRYYRCRAESIHEWAGLLTTDDRDWRNADNVPEAANATTTASSAAIIEVDVPITPARAFAAFTDDREYQRWLGVPVTITDGRFSATMEWGMEVRGTYEVVSAPHLIAMRWDFDDEQVPLPGRELIAYLRIDPTAHGSHVTVHQLAPDDRRSTFLARAWAVVLGRLVDAHRPDPPARPRRPRPKTADARVMR